MSSSNHPNQKILITGACGQLGIELAAALRKQVGLLNVITSDIRQPEGVFDDGPHIMLNILDREALFEAITTHKITIVYHLAAMLSAKGEQDHHAAWKLNMDSLINVLEAGRHFRLRKIFWPSSIAVFGPTTPKQYTEQTPYMDPSTMYGISKMSGERWCEYYFSKYNVDVRSLRYPGIISYRTPPGGGTTDYAVDIFHHAVEGKPFVCFLSSQSWLPMMYIDDAIHATLQLMSAPAEQIKNRGSYNVHAISFSPARLASQIQEHIPDFKITYQPDHRQAIADSWPRSIDDSQARNDWNWSPKYDLDKMTVAMIDGIRQLKISNRTPVCVPTDRNTEIIHES